VHRPTTHVGRVTRSTATFAVAAVLVATLVSCDDGDGSGAAASDPSSSGSLSASGSPSATVTSSPSTSPTEEPAPEPPKPPATKDTEAGRRAFAQFVIDSWSYALATNDASALTDLSPKSGQCEGCAEFAAELKKRRKQHWYVDFPGVKVLRTELSPGDLPGVWVATATINVPASTSYFRNGAVRNENDAHRGATFEVRMRLDGKRFSLLAFRVS
jgi:hypothetical protein